MVEAIAGIPLNGGEFCVSHDFIELPRGVKLRIVGVTHESRLFSRYKEPIRGIVAKSRFVAVESTNSGIGDLQKFGGGGYFGDIVALTPENIPVFSPDPTSQDNSVTMNIVAVLDYFGLPPLEISAGLTVLAMGVKEIQRRARGRITRRDFLRSLATKAVGFSTVAGLLAANPGTDDVVNNVADSCNQPAKLSLANQTPFGVQKFRNTAMITAMKKAAEQGIIAGEGVLFVGNTHAREIPSFYKTPQDAQREFEGTFFYQVIKLFGGMKLPVWKRQGNKFTKSTEIKLIF